MDLLTLNNQSIKNDLLKTIPSYEAILFVGAGCCKSINLPTWKELLNKFERIDSISHNQEEIDNDLIIICI